MEACRHKLTPIPREQGTEATRAGTFCCGPDAFRRRFGTGAFPSDGNRPPIRRPRRHHLGTDEYVQPDLHVLPADESADCLLVIEVADTSVEHDRSVKIPLYARAGVPEAWLVNLPADRIEVYRDPAGGSYAEVTSVSPSETVTPLLLPDARLSVADVLG